MNEFKAPSDGEPRDSNPMALSTWSSHGMFYFTNLLVLIFNRMHDNMKRYQSRLFLTKVYYRPLHIT